MNPLSPSALRAFAFMACATSCVNLAIAAELEAITVTATRAITATKTDTPLNEIPQAISVVTRSDLDVRDAQNLKQALDYSSGLAADSRMGFSGYDIIYSRGFTLDRFLDGTKLLGGLGYTAPQIEPFNLERLEVLRGPASTLYGSASSGGLVNAISKRPTFDPVHLLEVQGGSFGRLQGAVDLGGPIDDAHTFAYRVTALARDGDSYIDHVKEERYFVAPSVTWQPDADTSLTVLAQYQHDPRLGLYNLVPAEGTILPDPDGRVPRNRFLGETDFNQLSRTQASVGYQFETRIASAWTVRQNARYMYTKGDVAQLLPLFMADDRTLSRYSLTDAERIRALTLDNQIEGAFSSGAFSHRVLVGVDYQHLVDDEQLGEDFATDIDIFTPQYWTPIALPPIISDSRQRQQQFGVYAQDQIRSQHWVATLGARNDWASTDTRDRLFETTTKQDSHAFTGRAGLNYVFDSGLSPYVNYSRSFQPTPGTDFNGRAFDPVTGKQFEVGLKYQPAQSRNQFTIAAFDLRQRNVLTIDPEHDFFLVQTGEIRSRGIELGSTVRLADSLTATASYTYLDSTVTRSNGPDLDKRPVNVPRNSAYGWLYYALPVSARKISLGAGARYVGQTAGDTANDITVPGFVVADAVVRYDFAGDASRKGLSVAVNASNLFDKHYISECSNEVNCLYGTPRTLSGTLRYAW